MGHVASKTNGGRRRGHSPRDAPQTLHLCDFVECPDRAELFLYPGEEHLFADSSLPAYDAATAALLTERVLALLETVQAEKS